MPLKNMVGKINAFEAFLVLNTYALSYISFPHAFFKTEHLWFTLVERIHYQHLIGHTQTRFPARYTKFLSNFYTVFFLYTKCVFFSPGIPDNKKTLPCTHADSPSSPVQMTASSVIPPFWKGE